MLARNDRERADGFVLSLRWDDALARALAANESGTVADIFGQPLFGDAGEVSGGPGGCRVLCPPRPTLTAFAWPRNSPSPTIASTSRASSCTRVRVWRFASSIATARSAK